MPENKEPTFYNKTILNIMMLAQSGLTGPYLKGFSRKRKVPMCPIEEQSLDFLNSYLEDKIAFNEESFDIVDQYFQHLHNSSLPDIIEIVDEAENKFRKAVILKHKEEVAHELSSAPVPTPEEKVEEPTPIATSDVGADIKDEPKPEFVLESVSEETPITTYVGETLVINPTVANTEEPVNKPVTQVKPKKNKELNLNILDNKKVARELTSADLIYLANLVEEESNVRIKERRKNQLSARIKDKIDTGMTDTSLRDEKFEQLVMRYGESRDRDRLFGKKNEIAHESETSQTVDSVLPITPTFEVVQDTGESSEPIDLPLPEETVSPVFEETEPLPVEEATVKPTSHKKAEKKHYVSLAREEFLKRNQFSIVEKKKEMVNLSSADLLALAGLIQEEKGFSTTKKQDRLRSFISDRIDQTLAGDVAVDYNFDTLLNTFGSPKQRKTKIKTKAVDDKDILYEPSIDSEQTPKKPGWFSRSWTSFKRNVRKVALWAGAAVLIAFGTKAAVDKFAKSSDDSKDKDKKELAVDNTNQNDVEVITMEEVNEIFGKQPTAQSASVVETKADNNKTNTINEKNTYEQKYEEYVKSFLAIHKVDGESLINNINKLAKDGKIQFADGTNAAWYAHAFTMYDKVAPNSKENKMIKALMSGQEVSPQEINQLVINAGRNGTGVKGSGSYSDYDKASKAEQTNYRKARQSAYQAQLAEKSQQK